MGERSITVMELREILLTGQAESRKDEFKEIEGDWTYAIKGKTIDNRWLRVIVGFDGDTVVITVIDLDRGKLN